MVALAIPNPNRSETVSAVTGLVDRHIGWGEELEFKGTTKQS